VKRLTVTSVASGAVLDTVTLTDAGAVEYATGAAESMLAGRLGDDSDRAGEAFDRLHGWSNGYVSCAGDPPPAPRTGDAVDATTEADRVVDDAGDVLLEAGWVPPVPNVLADLREAGSDRKLRAYWVRGEGAAKIGWGKAGDFASCVSHLGKYVTDPEGLCAEYHKAATGEWPGKKRGH
jgi:hypothetical protein